MVGQFTCAVFCCLAALAAAAPFKANHHYGYRIVHVYPHDHSSFTQGLEYRGGFLYEGTGLEGRSKVRKEELESGRVLQETSLSPQYFGEGITVLNGRVVELTWKSHLGYVYEQASFHLLRTFSYAGEGWGLANDGHSIYMSDGTPQIRVLDSSTLQEVRRITVHDGERKFEDLNELEWVRDELYANVWQTNDVLRISPRDGTVLGTINLAGLLSLAEQGEGTDVLNGIAYDAMGDRLFVTGKLWPKVFEIRVIPSR